MAATLTGFSEPLISGRLGKLGALTSLYYDHYFVLDDSTLQYESSSGSGRMKSWSLDELQDCVRLPNKRDNEFTFVFSGERSGPIWKISVRAKTSELAAEWALSALRARDELRKRRAASPAGDGSACATSCCGSDALPTAAGSVPSASISTAAAGTSTLAPPRPPPPPPPPAPPPPPSGPPDATGRPQVLTTAELMRRHLQRRANQRLVEQKEEVLAALVHWLAAEWHTRDEARDAYDELSKRMDAIGLPVEGAEWQSRLLIPQKGGGEHFGPEQLALAGRAHERASALGDYTARSRQLQQRAAHARALQASLEANAELARERRIERLHGAVHGAVRVYREVLMCSSAQADQLRFEQARIPGSLCADGDELLAALPALSHGAFSVGQDELASLRREKASARRFRAQRVQVVLQQAMAVHTDVRLQLEHLGRAVPREVGTERAELEAACAELQMEAATLNPAAAMEDGADDDGI